jgi:alpha-beta hydrolase superfamily lysophospholipase
MRGMKAPVLMVHGMCCTGDVWSHFRTFFEARGARVFTPTLRPEARVSILGKPKRALSELGFADYARDLERETLRIAELTGVRPVVIGHSMGGLLAQVLAERNLVEAAVFISPTAPAGVQDRVTRLFWSAISLSNKLGIAPWAIKSRRSLVERTVLNALPAAERAAAYDAFVYESGRAFNDLGNWPVDETRIRVPVLTVAATRDRLVPAKLVRRTARKYAAVGGEFREYRAHGHWLYAEPGWEQPAADIFTWLEAVLDRPRAITPRPAAVALLSAL